MEIKTSPLSVTIEMRLTPREAQEILDFIDTRIDPGITQKKFYSAIFSIARMNGGLIGDLGPSQGVRQADWRDRSGADRLTDTC